MLPLCSTWNTHTLMLRITQDADTVVLHNIDHVFAWLQTPFAARPETRAVPSHKIAPQHIAGDVPAAWTLKIVRNLSCEGIVTSTIGQLVVYMCGSCMYS